MIPVGWRGSFSLLTTGLVNSTTDTPHLFTLFSPLSDFFFLFIASFSFIYFFFGGTFLRSMQHLCIWKRQTLISSINTKSCCCPVSSAIHTHLLWLSIKLCYSSSTLLCLSLSFSPLFSLSLKRKWFVNKSKHACTPGRKLCTHMLIGTLS